MLAVLIDRGLRPWEIEQLDPRQVRYLYFYPRDDSGNLDPDGLVGAEKQSYEEIFRAVWKRRGLDETAINKKWRAYLQGLK